MGLRSATMTVLAVITAVATPVGAQQGSASSTGNQKEGRDGEWTISTSTTPRGLTKSVDALASGVFGTGRDFDIILLRLECGDGAVKMSMSRPLANKERIFDAIFYKGYETPSVKIIRTYWRTEGSTNDPVFDGSPDELFSKIGDGGFDVLVGGERGQQHLFSFDVHDTSLALSRVKAGCSAK